MQNFTSVSLNFFLSVAKSFKLHTFEKPQSSGYKTLKHNGG